MPKSALIAALVIYVGPIQAGEATRPAGPFGVVMGSPIEGNGGKQEFASGIKLPYDEVIPAPPGFNKMVVYGTNTTGACRIDLELNTKKDPVGFERLKGMLVTKYNEPWSEKQIPSFNVSQWEVNPSEHNGIRSILLHQIGVNVSLSYRFQNFEECSNQTREGESGPTLIRAYGRDKTDDVQPGRVNTKQHVNDEYENSASSLS
ncbi:MAG: hypothetical protein OXP28_03325 [Gammaproteobacteria bacterium]|nr:hypothetical protein [Gammaproteobacteria bacterium]